MRPRLSVSWELGSVLFECEAEFVEQKSDIQRAVGEIVMRTLGADKLLW
jgi:hypothetical protein